MERNLIRPNNMPFSGMESANLFAESESNDRVPGAAVLNKARPSA